METGRLSYPESSLGTIPLEQRISDLETQLAAERKAHDATECRLEQTVAQLNHERKARERIEAHEKQLCEWVRTAAGPELVAAVIKRAFAAESRCAQIEAETIEQCAKVCEAYGIEVGDQFYLTCNKQCATAIRALLKEPK